MTTARILLAGAALGLCLTAPAGAAETNAAQSLRIAIQATAPAEPAPAAAATPLVDRRMLAAGLGAIAGIVAFNLSYGGTAALPLLYAEGAGAGAGVGAATGPVAASRVIAVSTAVAGALVGDWVYRKHAARHGVPREIAERVTPR